MLQYIANNTDFDPELQDTDFDPENSYAIYKINHDVWGPMTVKIPYSIHQAGDDDAINNALEEEANK